MLHRIRLCMENSRVHQGIIETHPQAELAACFNVLSHEITVGAALHGIVIRLFRVLQEMIPGLGLVLDCCTKPSQDLGDTAHFSVMFQEFLSDFLSLSIAQKVRLFCL